MCRVLASALLLGGILDLTARSDSPAHAEARGSESLALIDSIVVFTPYFSPNSDSILEFAEFRLFVSDPVELLVYVSAAGAADTLAFLFRDFYEDFRVPKDLSWNGVDRDGVPAPEGIYDVTFAVTDTMTNIA